MKLTKILPLIPIIGLLSSCAQTEVKVPNTTMVNEKQTEAPVDYVVYPDDRPSIADGKILWEKNNCAQCHGANGETAQGGKPALADKLYGASRKPVEQYQSLTYKDPHKLQTKLNSKEIWNLVVYARSLSNPPLSKEDMDYIAPVFGSNCAVCHGTKGDGEGPLARNLEPNPANFTTYRRFFDRTDDTLYDHIANGIKWEGMPNFLGKEDKKKNFKFDHDNIKKLVLYVRNFQVSSEGTEVAAAPAAAAPGSKASPAAATPPATSSSTDTSAEKKPEADAAASTSTAPAADAKAAPAKEADKTSESKGAETKAAGDASEKKNTTSDDKTH